MAKEKNCEQCKQRHKCVDVFCALGESTSPSITLKVIQAFLLPIVVLLVSLAAGEHIFKGYISQESLRTVIVALFALAITAAAVLIIKSIITGITKK